MLLYLLPILVTFTNAISYEWLMPYERTSIDDYDKRFFMNRENSPAISGGSAAGLGDFTQIGAIGWTQSNGIVEWNCGGSLIWENVILTAAHCTANDDNVPPDVTLLGNIVVGSSKDDLSGQMRNIVNFSRHPLYHGSTVYYDLALLLLDKKVIPDNHVVPACLWIDDAVPFKRLEAAGWGALGWGLSKSDHLMKVELQPLPNEDCAKYYNQQTVKRLRNGLEDHQLCAWYEQSDTCPGDSGGPLHYKLQYGRRTVPFLVGVTSFGKACGFSQPGVYVKVSKFTGWIIETLKQYGEDVEASMFEPQACASRYIELREYEKTIESRSGVNGVELLWPQGLTLNKCAGILAEPDAVITLAECVTTNGIAPNRVRLFGSEVIDITDVIVHPNYTERERRYYNNIAILKLKSWSTFQPHGIDYEDGYRSLIILSGIAVNGDKSNDVSSYEPVSIMSTAYDNENCVLNEQYSLALPRGLQDEHFCFGSEDYIIPGTCDLVLGGPIESNQIIYGLTLFGRDCGYGKLAVGLQFKYYKSWLESVFLPEKKDFSTVLSYFETDLDQDSECSYSNGVEGVCVPVDYCSAVSRIAKAQKSVIFCKSSSVVCCPTTLLKKQPSKIETEFNECKMRYKHLRTAGQSDWDPQSTEFSHTAAIGWSHFDKNVSPIGCYGYLISTRAVVTSAACLRKHPYGPKFVVLGKIGNFRESEKHLIETITVHPLYDETTREHDIGLIELEKAIEPNVDIFPACLWQHTTHWPLKQTILDNEYGDFKYIIPIYKSDCEKRLNRSSQETYCMNPLYGEDCVDLRYYENVYKNCLTKRTSNRTYCYNTGSPIVSEVIDKNLDITLYLVSVYSTGDCQAEIPLRFVYPVAFYIDWFIEVLE